MRYEDYDEQAFLNHLTQNDEKLKDEVKRIDDPLLRDVIYNVAHIVTRFADLEDENVLGASNHLEDELADLRDNMPVVDGPTERLDELENDVFELKQHIQKSEEKL